MGVAAARAPGRAITGVAASGSEADSSLSDTIVGLHNFTFTTLLRLLSMYAIYCRWTRNEMKYMQVRHNLQVSRRLGTVRVMTSSSVLSLSEDKMMGEPSSLLASPAGRRPTNYQMTAA